MVIFTCYQSEQIYTISTLMRHELPQTKRRGGALWHRPDDRRDLSVQRYRVWPQPEHFSPVFTFSY